jgi:hypothetical protein
MFDAEKIKKSMEVVGSDGVLVGTVDHVEGERLNLARVDSGQRPFDRGHFLSTKLISSIEDNKVRLSTTGNVVTQFDSEARAVARGTAFPPERPSTPFWNWNRIGIGAISAAAIGAAGAAWLGKRPHAEDDFEYRLETDENVRLISSEKVEGTKVVGRNGETLGEIKSFMVDKYTGRVAYAVMTFGGTMAMGKAFFPLPWPLLDYDVKQDGYALNITKEQLAKAPRFANATDVEFTPEYRRKVILFYRS